MTRPQRCRSCLDETTGAAWCPACEADYARAEARYDRERPGSPLSDAALVALLGLGAVVSGLVGLAQAVVARWRR